MTKREELMAKVRVMRKAMDAAGAVLTDEQALQAVEIYPEWRPGVSYTAGQRVRRGEKLYNVIQPVVAMEHQPPEAAGMLAIYRPIDTAHAGTLEDPIPWTYGMDCSKGSYYSYEGATYLCNLDMPACVWAPNTPGLWQWEAA